MPAGSRCPTACSTARRTVAHLGGRPGKGTGTGASRLGSEVCLCIHSRQAAITIELTGSPVRAEAWSRRWYISSVKRTVVAFVTDAI